MVGHVLHPLLGISEARGKANKVPERIKTMITAMETSPHAVVAAMVFMIEETRELNAVINLTQERNSPVAPVLADKIDSLVTFFETAVKGRPLHPRVEIAINKAPFPEVLREMFKLAFSA